VTGPDEAQRIARRQAAAGGLLVLLSGPSGAGKDAVRNAIAQRGRPYYFAVTYTTREARPDERDGWDYHFVKPEAAFEALISQGRLLEYERYPTPASYGSPRIEVREALSQGRVVLLRMDVRGAIKLKRLIPGAVSVFVYAPSVEILRKRMERRGEPAEALERRLMRAIDELGRIDDFDYAVLNEDNALERAVDLTDAIISAELCRVGRTASVVD